MTAIDNVLNKTILQVVQLQPIPITSSLTEKQKVFCVILPENLVKQKIHQEPGRPETIWLITHCWVVFRWKKGITMG